MILISRARQRLSVIPISMVSIGLLPGRDNPKDVCSPAQAQVGDRVRPGDQVMTIVPLDHLWVEANLWESRMHLVRPGQPVLVNVDLYGTTYTYHGTVEGLVPGTGSVFALLPPDNATGNFIHIVQRVPVRIALRKDEILKHPIRPGLSTEFHRHP
jgi:membrane fusion protein (multidrug efflux system)